MSNTVTSPAPGCLEIEGRGERYLRAKDITAALGLPPTASVDEVVGAIERLQDDCGHLKLAAFEACAIGIECGDEPTESLRQQVNELIDTCLAREEPNPC